MSKAREGALEMGEALLKAQSRPELYPEFKKPSGEINMQKLLRGEFGIGSSTGYRYMDFVALRKKLSQPGKQFPESMMQVDVLAPHKNDDTFLRKKNFLRAEKLYLKPRSKPES